MSDSAYHGDAARLEAALERIGHALDRAVHRPVPAPDPGTPAAPASDGDHAADAAPALDLAAMGARLDGLIAELRQVLGEGGAPSGDAAAHS